MPAVLTSPGPGEAPHVWLLRVGDRAAGLPGALGMLDERERGRYEKFRLDKHRTAYGVAHVALRELLAAYTGVPAAEQRFVSQTCPTCGGPHGRPAVATEDAPHFSLSHSGELVLIAFAGTPVGADVEELPTVRTADEIAPRLHPRERDEIVAVADDDERRTAFARCWTRKEAYLKGTGEGLSGGLGRDYVGAAEIPGRPPGWRLADTDAPAGYRAAIALADPDAPPPAGH
ncbi:4'-phosphopantetheinyl transferase superfamily protein [Streptomyces sp. SL13]|uniref:4'-phosphopantetheinyl transferase superfamily protein n=1 Tax=Streptantibioticus silvisoli TaxID=2705255 RepID=A0AA90H9B0_9ACTN|nr:4'-phosphopantetheinyl transferase superfamily protein [Streptantibioticus silvisoli]MDI5967039.1 4'-phosphopantetheinyl transferase superfamily protein [Streptantibioticus silvisoli]MDI5974226.1 4'-phosphopantetheinyl transferase superfamily protein [Streptantibioticus silvisoli]